MRKNFGPQTWMYPMPVLIIGTYDEKGNPNAMNAAWGGIFDYNQIMVCLSAHKTTDNIKKNKAYLQLPLSVFAGASTVGTRFDDEEGTTGIEANSQKPTANNQEYYNLQGQRVENPGKGIYILNGKKVIKK